MNLVGMLGKMLLNGAMSKGGAGGLGSLLGGAAQGQGGQADGQAGGLGGLLAGLGGAAGGAGGAGGLGELLGQLQKGGGAGGLGELLGGAAAQGGGQAQDGGAGQAGGGLLGGMLGGNSQSGGGLGDLLGTAFGQQAPGAQAPQASNEQNDHAAMLIRAMVNAAKCDGAVDQEEQEKIVGQLGDIGQEEANFIRSEMQAPLDVDAFARSVPRGMEQQVYVLSLMSINLDSKAEADYLDRLSKGLNISEQVSNQLHTEMGAPQLFS